MNKEISFVAPLVKENIAPATQLLVLQRDFESSRALKEKALSTIEQGKLSIIKINKQIENVKGQYVLRSMEELNKVVADHRKKLEDDIIQMDNDVRFYSKSDDTVKSNHFLEMCRMPIAKLEGKIDSDYARKNIGFGIHLI